MERDEEYFIDPLSSGVGDAFSYESQISSSNWPSPEPLIEDDMKNIDLYAPNEHPPQQKEPVNHVTLSTAMHQDTDVQAPPQQPIITTRLHYVSSPTSSSNGDGSGPSSSIAPPPPPSSSSSSSYSSLPLSLRPSLRSAPLAIKVTDPIKREQSGIFGISSSYTSYLVTSQSSGVGSSTKAVRRRFKDFVTLADVLKATFRGHFLPPRPEKNAVEGQRMSEAFVEDRRSSLESYLRQLAGHPDIATSEVLAVFLNEYQDLSQSSTWWSLIPLHLQQKANGGGGGLLLEGTTKLAKQIMGQEKKVLDPIQAALPTRSVVDPLRAIKETAQSMHQSKANSSSSNGLRSPDEAALSRASSNIEGHKEALAATSKAAEYLIRAMDARALVDGDLGLALHKLSGYEEAHGSTLAQFTGTVRQHQQIVSASQASSSALIKAARVGRTATGKAASELAALHDYLALMPNAAKGLKHREKQLLTADTLDSDLARARRSISDLEAANAKVLGTCPVKQRQIEELKEESVRLEQSIVAASAEYEKIKAANFKELDRLQSDMRQDFSHMLKQFVAGQAASAGRGLEVWLQAASELGVKESELDEIRKSSQ